MVDDPKYVKCPGCGSEDHAHAEGCTAWEAVVGPFATPNPPYQGPGTPPHPSYVPGPRTGWVCPRCGAGIAPWMPYCSFCRPDRKEES